MTEDDITITRRTVLGSLGAVGVGAAAAGLGTTAVLNDEEIFDGNTTTAGTLDLKVDWQQHYHGPDGEVFVNAHPDHDDDGKQSVPHPTEPYVAEYTGRNLVDLLTCETPGFDEEYDFAAPNRGLDDGGPLTEQESLVHLEDVKPGDSGEITFSLHLCGNPGYLWMGGAEVQNTENGYAEPEPTTVADGDTRDPTNSDGRGELAEAVEVELWYDDDCDNERDDGEVADLVFTLDASGSMLYDEYGGLLRDEPITVDGDQRAATTKIDLVERGVRQFLQGLIDAGAAADVQVGVVFFDGFDPDDGSLAGARTDVYSLRDPVTLDATLGNFRDVVASLTGGNADPMDGSGLRTGTALEPGIEAAQAELAAGRSDVRAVNVVFTDGEPWRDGNLEESYFDGVAGAADAARSPSSTPATDVYVIGDTAADPRAQDLVLAMAGQAGSDGGDQSHRFDLTSDGTIPRLFQQVAQLFVPEAAFYRGTLADALDELEDGRGIPLDANRFTPFDELADPADAATRDPFLPEMTRCVGFRWWLPAAVGNEIQGDGLSFDLGFYGEQARHNGPSAD